MPIHTIWLADDDADDCMLFGDAIAELGAGPSVVCVGNGVELMDKLQHVSHVPDVLFLDVNMPVKDGLTCLAEIKGDERFKDLPIVIWSTSAQPEAVRQAFELGARLFMKKPYNFNKLTSLLEGVLQLNLHAVVSQGDFLVGK
ncbi:response regulator [Dawidia soli]|uniref:Response regulator n=1 Tax=Dawidia soli TaxID=2782352 RepID=A0AAP2D9C0_9BACT|nr:response regulator [Dawidia soli]MBT1685002.1 response regulator [Dawidia soli]